MCIRDRCINEKLFIPEFSTLYPKINPSEIAILFAKCQHIIHPESVSYTHLDVYKRQEENSLDFVHKILSSLGFNEDLKKFYLEESFSFLNLLKSLPEEYKTGKRKLILLSSIFEDSHNRINSSTSIGIVNFLKEKKGRTRFQRLSVLTENVLARDFKVLQILSRKFTNIQSIIDAMGDLPEIEEELSLIHI